LLENGASATLLNGKGCLPIEYVDELENKLWGDEKLQAQKRAEKI